MREQGRAGERDQRQGQGEGQGEGEGVSVHSSNSQHGGLGMHLVYNSRIEGLGIRLPNVMRKNPYNMYSITYCTYLV